jgi:hypothetical protein
MAELPYEAYRWFLDVPPGATASKERALAWLDTPNARVAATAVGFGKIQADELLDRARDRLLASALPDWENPEDAIEFLRAVLVECLPS